MGARSGEEWEEDEAVEEVEGVYGGSFSFRVICGSLAVRIDAASRPITIHRTTITPLGYILTRVYTIPRSLSLLESPREERGRGIGARSNTFLPAHLYLIINRRDFGQVPHKEEGEKRDLERESLEIFFRRWRRKRRFWRVICFLSFVCLCISFYTFWKQVIFEGSFFCDCSGGDS